MSDSRASRRAVRALLTAMLALGPLRLAAQFSYSEDFKNNTADGWNFYTGSSSPGPFLTSGAGDAVGDGWLRLASPTTNQANAVYFDTPIPSAGNRVSISFSANMYGGNGLSGTGADGLVFFLYDASQAFNPGAFGGSLGYAQKDGINGLGGGYLGVALDVFGNFSNPTEGRQGGVGFAPNAVVVRGPGNGQDGYLYLGGTTGSNGTVGYDYTDSGSPTVRESGDSIVSALPYTMGSPGSVERPNQSTQYRKVEVVLDENSQIIVRMQFGEDGLWYDVLNLDVSSFVRPEQLRIGFSSGTGDGTMTYEVGGILRIDATAGSGNFMWDNDEGPASQIWGTSATNPLNWFGNTNPIIKSNIIFNSAYINQAQNIDLRGSDKVVKNLYFSGPNAYSLLTTESRRLIFDSDTVGGLTTISLTNDVAGNAAHTIGVDILMNKQLDVNNNITPTFTIAGNIDTNGNALALKGTGTTVVTGVIAGAGTVSKSDAGSVTLSGANTYTGATTVTGGTLTVTSAAALGSTAAGTTVSSGGTLALAGAGTAFAAETLTLSGTGVSGGGALRNDSGNNTWTGAITLSGTGSNSIGAAAGTTLTAGGVISGAAGNNLVKVGDGTLVLSGANTYAGATAINGGTVRISADNNLGSAPGAATAGHLAFDGGTLNTASTFTLNANRGIALNSGGGTIDTAAGTTFTYAGVAAGAGALNKAGSGTLVLGGANTYAGATNVNAGTLQLSGSNRIADTSAVTVASGATFALNNNSDTVGSLAGSGALSLGSGTLTFGGTNADTTWSGVASGTGGLVKNGTGTTTLTGANTYTGALRINAGAVALGASNVLANGSTLELAGGTFRVAGNFSDTVGTLSLLGNSTIDFGGNTSALTFTNATRSTGNLTIDNWAGSAFGNGDSRLVFTNAPTGFTVNGTTGQISEISFSGWGSGAVRLASGEVVPFTGGTVYTYALTGNGTWNTDNNWLDGSGSNPAADPGTWASVAGDTAILGSSATGPASINLNGANRTLGYLVANNANLYTVTGNTLVLDVNGGQSQIVNQGAGGLTISSGVSLASGDALTVTQAGSGALTISGALNNNANTVTVTGTGSGQTTLSGVVSGTGGLVKSGTGILLLSGTNTYSGNTAINGGVVRVSADANLGAAPGSATVGKLAFNGGTLNTTADFTLNANRGIALNAGGGTFNTNSGTTLTYAGIAAGAGALNKDGAGTLILGGANTYTGATNVLAGTLQLSAAERIANSSALTIAAGATFNANGFSETVASLSGAGTLALGSPGAATTFTSGADNSSTTFSGVISGGSNATFASTGTGTLTLSGNNTYTGATTIASGGAIRAASNTALGTTAGGVTVASGGALELTGGINIGAEALTLSGSGLSSGGALRNLSGANAASGAVTLNASTEIQSDAGSLTLSGAINGNAAGRLLTVDGAGDTTLSGNIGGNVGVAATNSLIKTGSGTLTLSGANSYLGTTQVLAGTVVAGSATALGATADGTTVANGATLALSGAGFSTAERLSLNGQGVGALGALRNLSGNNTVTGTVALLGESYVGVASGTTLTATGVVSGTGFGLTKIGDGTLVLSGANTYTGTTAVTTGTLEVRSNAGLGTNAAPTTIATGATLAFNSSSGNITTNENITLAGTGVGAAGGLQATGTSGTTTLSGTITLNADATIGAAAGATLRQTGTLTEESGADYNLVKTGAGTLELAGVANGYNGTTTVRAGTLVVGASAPVSGNGALGNASSIVQVGDSGTGSATVSLLAGGTSGGVTIDRAIAINNQGSGTTLGGNNTSGTNTFNGAVTLNKDVSLVSSTGGTVLYNGAIGGVGAVSATGGGTTVLAGANTYAGATTVANGATLVAASASALGSAAAGTTVQSGGTLGLQNNVSVAESLTLNGGTLNNRADANTYAGSITLGSASTISNTAGDLNVSGAISGAHALTLNTSAGALTTLSASNSHSGLTTVSGSGVLTLAAGGSGALASTSGVTVGSGATLAFGASEQINNSATLTLSGGTVRLGGFQEVMSNLALSAGTTSFVDYAEDGSLLRFTGTATVGASSQLTISNWAGNPLAGGSGSYGLLFNSQAEANAFENSVLFDGWSTLGTNQVVANGIYWEIVPSVTVREWGASIGGSWDTNANWAGNAQPDSTGAIALFGNAITAGSTVTVNTQAGNNDSEVVGKLIFDTTGGRGYNIGNSGSTSNGRLDIDVSSGTGQIIVSGDGQHTISTAAGIRVLDDTVITNDGTSAVGLTISAPVDLRNGASSDLTVGGAGRTVISGVISNNTGGASLIKTGSGSLALSGANSYSGNTTLRSGTLEITGNAPDGAAGNLGNSTAAVIVNDSVTGATADTTLLMTDGNGGSTLGRDITVNGFGATTTLGGTNSSGTNTFSGDIALNKSVSLTAASGGTVAFSGVLTNGTGVNDVTKVGAGTVVLSNTGNNYDGATRIDDGTLRVTANAIPTGSAVTVASGAKLELGTAAAGTDLTIGSLAGAGTVDLPLGSGTTHTLTTGFDSTSTTFSGVITDTGASGVLALAKTGTGTFTVSGNNSYIGATSINQGTLVAASNTALGTTAGATSVLSGATLGLRNNITITDEIVTLNTTTTTPVTNALYNVADTNVLAGNVVLAPTANNQVVRLGAAAGTQLTVSGNISQNSFAANLTKTDAGTVILSGANSYTGATNIAAGTLVAANNAALGTTAAGTSVQNGATLGLQGGVNIGAETLGLAGAVTPSAPSIRNLSGDNTSTGAITLSGAVNTRVEIDVATGSSLTLNGAIVQAANPNGVTKTGGGTLNLGGGGANTFTGGFTINGGTVVAQKTAGVTATGAGDVIVGDNTGIVSGDGLSATLRLGASNQISDTSHLIIRQDGAFDLQGFTETTGAVTMTGGTITGSGTLTLGGNLTFSGVGSVTSSISSNLALGASSRIVQIGNNGINGDSDTVISGVVSGSGQTLRKTDLGTLELSGTSSNTFSGGLQVDDGVVVLNKTAGLNAIGGGTVTLGDGLLGAGTATLRYAASNQLPDSTDIVFRSDGRLDMNGRVDTIDEIDSAIAGAGQILIGTGQLIVGSNNGDSIYSGTLSGTTGGVLEKVGTGTLTLSDADAARGDRVMDFGGELKLEAGTLALDNITLNVATLRLTGNSVIDFGGSSTLNVGALIVELASGETTTITSWNEFVDYFYADSFSDTEGGANIPFDTRGQAPQNRIVFANWTGNNTWWQSWDKQVTPVPEPASYGALAIGGLIAFTLTRRRRRAAAESRV